MAKKKPVNRNNIPIYTETVPEDTKTRVGFGPALKQIGWYALAFLASLLYMEIILHLKIHGNLSAMNGWYLLFLVPISLVLAALTGWWKRKELVNHILGIVLTFLISIFYMADFIYYCTFGSLFSVSMMGMGGDAITNFWWSLKLTILENMTALLLFQVPTALMILAAFLPGKHTHGYKPAYHAVAFGLAVAVWIVGVAVLPLGGKADHTAYGAYHSKFVDTDTASEKLGALTNCLVELKSTVFGTAEDSGVNAVTDVADLVVKPNPEKKTDETQEQKPEEEQKIDPEDLQVEEIDFSANIYPELDFDELMEYSPNKKITALCEYMASNDGSVRNEYTGLFEGYNLIYICAESFSSLALNEKVTPTLCKLASEGIVLNNYYNSFKNTTTNGEYAFLTGIWPDVSRAAKMGTAVGSMPQSADKNMFTALGNMFNTQGVTSRGYHNYKGSYYHRNESLPNMGFTCKFKGAGMKFTTSWPTSDYEMFQQSVDDYINDDQFCAYYMTFSGHGGYTNSNCMYNRNISTVKKLLGKNKLTDIAKGYLACNYELEKAMEYLLQRLEEAGKLENTVIVLTGDHYPYYVYEEARNSLAGHKVDTTFEIYKSTCTIWCGGIETPIQVDTPCCNVDILPTILNLFNIPYDSRLYSGVDIFGDSVHIAQLYNKSFITDIVQYNNAKGKATWLIDTSEYSEDDLQAYLDSMIEIVKERYESAVSIGDTDFYQFVWDNYDVAGINNAVNGVEANLEEEEDDEDDGFTGDLGEDIVDF